ncbi:SET domain-containing protein [Diaporthe helianthi]|uniref:SET domain-containing protein n=1 Tax=Diaporthe helianthi TaxID=158607 RepID=A0A2P5HKE4_DIAHE|nr:SET domain-containing protein [Diaporthe helianthi]
MPRQRLPLKSIHVWTRFNNGILSNVEVESVPHKGSGLIAKKHSAAIVASPLISIPHSLVLNAEAVEAYAKEDSSFRLLVDACGHKTPRHDVLLFLLVHLVLSSDNREHAGLANPWTEYVKFLDDAVPVPTLWQESDRSLLRGTSLEAALNAKMLALNHEFEELREKSSGIECWNAAFWVNYAVSFADWLLVDAWYRSRVLELPRSGPSLVPCIDMVNHSTDANAYYEENINDDVVILLRPGGKVKEGDEVNISYGSEKPAAEMLFSYGFIDSTSSMKSLRLPLRPLLDDPLGKAKVHAFQDAPVVDIKEVDGKLSCTSPFAFLMILNEEDGLDFRLLQDNDGGRELRTFWRDEDVTEKTSSFDQLVSDHELCGVFKLRVNMVISQRLEEQLERLSSIALDIDDAACATGQSRSANAANARTLRLIEKGVLDKAVAVLEEQRTELLALEDVAAYLGAMTISEGGLHEVAEDDSNDEFS